MCKQSPLVITPRTTQILVAPSLLSLSLSPTLFSKHPSRATPQRMTLSTPNRGTPTQRLFTRKYSRLHRALRGASRAANSRYCTSSSPVSTVTHLAPPIRRMPRVVGITLPGRGCTSKGSPHSCVWASLPRAAAHCVRFHARSGG